VIGMELSISAKAREYIVARGGAVNLVDHQGMSMC